MGTGESRLCWPQGDTLERDNQGSYELADEDGNKNWSGNKKDMKDVQQRRAASQNKLEAMRKQPIGKWGGGKKKRKTHKQQKRRKTKKTVKKTKKTKQKKMIVHQIFFNIGKGELHEIPRFYECYQNNKKKCKGQGIQYKLWTRKMVEDLLEKQENKQFKRIYYEFDQDIMRIDFGRYLILYRFGGIYIDLDICMMNKSITHLFEKDYFFVRWHDSKLPYIAILGTKKNNSLYKDILEHCEESYDEKKKQEIYKSWKGRFVFQTTGHFMLKRVLKKHKITDYLDIVKIKAKDGRIVQGPNPLFEDTSASVWYK